MWPAPNAWKPRAKVRGATKGISEIKLFALIASGLLSTVLLKMKVAKIRG